MKIVGIVFKYIPSIQIVLLGLEVRWWKNNQLELRAELADLISVCKVLTFIIVDSV